MTEPGDDTAPITFTQKVESQVTAPTSRKPTTIEKLAKHAMAICHVGKDVIRETKHPRYINLKRNEMFTSLVNFYATQFRFMKDHYSVLAENFTMLNQARPWETFAKVYLSHWFVDLYVSNREASLRHEALLRASYFERELTHQSLVYDNFLQLLNASIRPTHIKGCFEDTLFVPLINDQIDWTNPQNPFNITNFHLDLTLFRALIGKMKNAGLGWKTSTLSTDALGRPSWLFDWHEGCRVAAWFPEEGNYNKTDVGIAYLVGVACTPILASPDFDAWTAVPMNYPHDPRLIDDYERSSDYTFYGAYEVKTINFRTYTVNGATPEPIYDRARTVLNARHAAELEEYQREQARQTQQPEQVDPYQHMRSTADTARTSGAMVLATSYAQATTVPQTPRPQAPTFPDTPPVVQHVMRQYQLTSYKYYRRIIKRYDEATRTGAHRILALGLSV